MFFVCLPDVIILKRSVTFLDNSSRSSNMSNFDGVCDGEGAQVG